MDVPTTLGIEALKMEFENVRPESIPARHCGKNIEGYHNRIDLDFIHGRKTRNIRFE